MLTDTVVTALGEMERATLMDIVQRNIVSGFRSQPPIHPVLDLHTPALQRMQASFVMLRDHGRLVGCAGTVQPSAPLLYDVGHNAYEAACHCAGRNQKEQPCSQVVAVEVWLVGPLREIQADSIDALCEQLNVGSDGALLEHATGRATLTPDKWRGFPEPQDFVRQLCDKAGLAEDEWGDDVQVAVYTVEPLPAIEVNLDDSWRSTKPR